MSALAEDQSHARARVHELLKRYGWNAVSFQSLGAGFRYWFDGNDACVAYVDTGRAWIAAGAPIAAPDSMAGVALRFTEAAAAARRRVSFFGTEERFQRRVSFRAIHIGEQPTWNPRDWEAVLRASSSLREQLRRARAKGVTVRALAAPELARVDQATRRSLDALAHSWMNSRPMPPMRFLVQLDPFAFVDDKRHWIAEHQGRPVGWLVAAPIYDRQGWLFEHLLREGRTPNGTPELLIDQAMRDVRDQGSGYVTLGLVPLSGAVGGLLRLARFLGQGFYDFEGLRRFKTKLRPSAWTPIALSVPPRRSRTLAIYDVLNAFAGGGLGRFGWQAIWSKPPLLARVLALSLIPWTAALALAGPRPWFPTSSIWAAWILFDLALIGALLTLAQRWRRWLGMVIASLTGADAGLTLWEGLSFNLSQEHGALPLAVIATAVLGPALASFFLWHALGDFRRGSTEL